MERRPLPWRLHLHLTRAERAKVCFFVRTGDGRLSIRLKSLRRLKSSAGTATKGFLSRGPTSSGFGTPANTCFFRAEIQRRLGKERRRTDAARAGAARARLAGRRARPKTSSPRPPSPPRGLHRYRGVAGAAAATHPGRERPRSTGGRCLPKTCASTTFSACRPCAKGIASAPRRCPESAAPACTAI
jgi:hypothetical protein